MMNLVLMSILKGEEIRVLTISGYDLNTSFTYGCINGLKKEALRSGLDIRIRNIFLDLCNKSNSLEERELDFIMTIKAYDPKCILALDDSSLIYMNNIQKNLDSSISYYYYGFSDSIGRYTGIPLKAVIFVNMYPTILFNVFDNIFLDKKVVVFINNNYYDTSTSYIMGKRFVSSAKPYHQCTVLIMNSMYSAIQYLKENESSLESNVYINCMNSVLYNNERICNTKITLSLLKYLSSNSIIIDYSYASIDKKGFITICPDYVKDGEDLMKLVLSTYHSTESVTSTRTGSEPILYFDKACIPYDNIQDIKEILQDYEYSHNFKIK